MYCPYCQVKLPDGTTVCPECRRQIVDVRQGSYGQRGTSSYAPDDRTFITCPHCGEHVEPDSAFCSACGKRLFGADLDSETSTGGQTQAPKESSRLLMFASIACVVLAATLVAMLALQPKVGEPVNEGEASTTTTPEKDSEGPETELNKDIVYDPEEEPDPIVDQEVVIEQVTPPAFDLQPTASSELPADQYTAYYGPGNAVDGNHATAWNEGSVDGSSGIGQWLQLNASSEQVVRSVRIVAGYPKTERVYYLNCRPKQVTISLSDGYTQTATLDDLFNSEQTIELDGPHKTTFVKVTIDSLYYGQAWGGKAPYNDTCIAELAAS